ncbi:QueT transporter family protein [Calorimonas adulescens]|jgi:QueT transporter.|uniref:QueT transporter family protein n=1 Tax=Calorimonas adulescens TaxID=2606906 RepID=A0A5D8QJL7_9THEO|nr:QueT transporter family protein [Calorimonas adulescens]TZE83478.1 QueT transporter family protein [Calorimonas adulescens]
MNVKYITKAAIIAVLYIVLTYVMGLLSFNPLQLRLSEGLTILPLLEPAAIPGLFIGCLFANLQSPFGIIDILGGSLVTLVAAYLTSKAKSFWMGALPPIILNSVFVSIWVSYFTKVPYIVTMGGIALGEGISVVLFGYIIYNIYKNIARIYLK